MFLLWRSAMKITRLLIKGYKLLRDVTFEVNSDINIFVGENDSGKSTILEAISILSSGKLHGYAFDKQVKANMFNDILRKEYKNSLRSGKTVKEPPNIIFEAYCDSDDVIYSGTNNELGKDCPGIRVEVEFDATIYEDTYKKLLQNGEIYDIPVEFYKVSYKYFNGNLVFYRYCPIKAAFIDTTRKDYSYVVDRFVSENITTYLSPEEQTNLSSAYRKSRNEFHINEVVQRLNDSVKENVHIANKTLAIDLKEEDIDNWKRQMSVVVDMIPFENIGFGSQNTIKVELALKNSEDQVNLVLMEEPENNLSFANMAQLVQHVRNTTGKQVFISTHSSYVANKLDLGNIFLVYNGKVTSFLQLYENTKQYFIKLPGYDTLRFVLAEKVILVEGPTDEMILERCYLDDHGHLPLADGIDIIVVDSLAFKRYCDIAVLLSKKTVIVTDNDGDIQKNIQEKYADYLDKDYLVFIYEHDKTLNTIEPSVLKVNCIDAKPTEAFKKAISKNNSMMDKSIGEIMSFM